MFELRTDCDQKIRTAEQKNEALASRLEAAVSREHEASKTAAENKAMATQAEQQLALREQQLTAELRSTRDDQRAQREAAAAQAASLQKALNLVKDQLREQEVATKKAVEALAAEQVAGRSAKARLARKTEELAAEQASGLALRRKAEEAEATLRRKIIITEQKVKAKISELSELQKKLAACSATFPTAPASLVTATQQQQDTMGTSQREDDGAPISKTHTRDCQILPASAADQDGTFPSAALMPICLLSE
eukprot:SAG31_NODE_5539_length_2468_cov_1.853103_3_plen_251_part_00